MTEHGAHVAEGRAGIFPPVPRSIVYLISAGAAAWCAGVVALSLAVPAIG